MIRLFLKNAERFPQHFFWWVYGGNVVIENRQSWGFCFVLAQYIWQL
jgi:hypothetical protein